MTVLKYALSALLSSGYFYLGIIFSAVTLYNRWYFATVISIAFVFHQLYSNIMYYRNDPFVKTQQKKSKKRTKKTNKAKDKKNNIHRIH